MEKRRYKIDLKITDNKKGEMIRESTEDVDGYLYLHFNSGEVTTIAGADFGKVLGPLLVNSIVNKFGSKP